MTIMPRLTPKEELLERLYILLEEYYELADMYLEQAIQTQHPTMKSVFAGQNNTMSRAAMLLQEVFDEES